MRVTFRNQLPLGTAGNLPLPVDTSLMGSGEAPGGTTYTQNRAELHLHGGLNPYISDGTPHQWITPAGDPTPNKKGVSFATAGDGIGTYFYTNQQSSRLMFYHDHTFGLTRLNVYMGEAAGYLLVDDVEKKLINDGILPNNGGGVYNHGIPLIIQDKVTAISGIPTSTCPTRTPAIPPAPTPWDGGTTVRGSGPRCRWPMPSTASPSPTAPSPVSILAILTTPERPIPPS